MHHIQYNIIRVKKEGNAHCPHQWILQNNQFIQTERICPSCGRVEIVQQKNEVFIPGDFAEVYQKFYHVEFYPVSDEELKQDDIKMTLIRGIQIKGIKKQNDNPLSLTEFFKQEGLDCVPIGFPQSGYYVIGKKISQNYHCITEIPEFQDPTQKQVQYLIQETTDEQLIHLYEKVGIEHQSFSIKTYVVAYNIY